MLDTITCIQYAEQLDAPWETVAKTYGNSTWQNRIQNCALEVVPRSGDGRGEAVRELGLQLGLMGHPRPDGFPIPSKRSPRALRQPVRPRGGPMDIPPL